MPLPLGQEHEAEGEGVEPSRPGTRAVGGSTVFETVAVANRLALPYAAAATGIEPVKGRLTAACLYQHRPHRNKVRVAGFEPGTDAKSWSSQAPPTMLRMVPGAMPGFATL
jgi:hypothetical protein